MCSTWFRAGQDEADEQMTDSLLLNGTRLPSWSRVLPAPSAENTVYGFDSSRDCWSGGADAGGHGSDALK